MTQPVRLIVGLANPGRRYAKTRHNVGAVYARALVEQCGGVFKSSALCKAEVAQIHTETGACHVMVPLTYMNLSGQAVRRFVHYYRLPLASVVVAQDDLDFLPGVVKLKLGGGPGGHNGIANISQELASTQYYRLRFGIGRPNDASPLESYVLSQPSAVDREHIALATARSLACTGALLQGDMATVMQALHTT